MEPPLLGQVKLFAGNFIPRSWALCDGATLDISSNEHLFSILGTQYGGDGRTNFRLPNLAPPAQTDGGTATVRHIICVEGSYPGPLDDRGTMRPGLMEPFVGGIELFPAPSSGPFAGDRTPLGWALCDGATLDIRSNQDLFWILGTQYGGDFRTNFQLPNLAPPAVTDGGTATVRHIICIEGIYPCRWSSLAEPNDEGAMMDVPFLGQIKLFAGDFAPRGWALCDGTALDVSSNQALFSILGTQYGGDGRTSFQLPNLVPLAETDGGTATIGFIICVEGIYPNRSF